MYIINKYNIYIYIYIYTFILCFIYIIFICVLYVDVCHHYNNNIMGTGALGHSHIWLHFAGIQESKECFVTNRVT